MAIQKLSSKLEKTRSHGASEKQGNRDSGSSGEAYSRLSFTIQNQVSEINAPDNCLYTVVFYRVCSVCVPRFLLMHLSI
jgi:hypothetical protein